MLIRLLNNNDATVLDSYLGRDWASTMFMRANLMRAGVDYTGDAFSGEYLGAFDGSGALVGVMVHYWNGGVMSCVDNDSILQDLIPDFQDMITRPVTSVLGDDRWAQVVIHHLDLTDKSYRANRAETLYYLQLDNLVMPAGFDFSTVVMVSPHDMPKSLLTDWIRDYEREAIGAPDNDAQETHIQNRVQTILKGHNHWILLADGIPVCLSGFNAMLSDVVQVGPVWTPPEHRGRGYARALVALTLKQAQENGVTKTVLFTDNPSAKKTYEAIGYEKIGSYRLAILR